ncbi:hypothetical protein BDN72DRAFT_319363 [Pluteus cervinus]|uniref:Uncharacterized protein n=1 Tax=Pluteus cervinus TaxID=181527 RepID=A0ACD3AFB6_9AGAR|nr:hypothetical protein BDN72DRAFT_319363 [Pluteus cervinus]
MCALIMALLFVFTAVEVEETRLDSALDSLRSKLQCSRCLVSNDGINTSIVSIDPPLVTGRSWVSYALVVIVEVGLDSRFFENPKRRGSRGYEDVVGIRWEAGWRVQSLSSCCMRSLRGAYQNCCYLRARE